jgi:uncharacterized sulfatase
VHTPLFPPEGRRGDGSKRARYAGVLQTLDEQLGGLFARIREDESLRDNTLVVLCSDNGPEPGAGSAGPFRGRKGTLYEGGIRSPLVVWGQGFIDKSAVGSVNAASYFAAIDLVPSLLEVAGVASPDGVTYDGHAMTEVLFGKSKNSRPEPIFFRRPPDRPKNAAGDDLPDLAVRDGKWKLLCNADGSQVQLYDLDADRRERNNLASSNPVVAARLVGAVIDWHKSMPADRGAEYDLLGSSRPQSLRRQSATQ